MTAEFEDQDDNYVSEEDSDFAPDDAAEEDESLSSDDDEAAEGESAPAKPDRKRPAADSSADDVGFENSGDEAIIERGKKKQKRHQEKAGADADREEEDGPLIKTRRMRAAEKEGKYAKIPKGPVTIDVDKLWQDLISAPVVRVPGQDTTATTQPQPNGDAQKPSQSKPVPNAADESEYIRIKRTYTFAGKTHTEEKLVHRESAEAKLYLAETGQDPSAPAVSPSDADQQQKRMPRKAFRSAFEPVPADGTGVSQRSDLNLGIAKLREQREKAEQAKKLNTVEKSRMDWAGYVDREGIKDELEMAGKSKHSFVARQEFLARSEAVREEEVRRLRLAGKV